VGHVSAVQPTARVSRACSDTHLTLCTGASFISCCLAACARLCVVSFHTLFGAAPREQIVVSRVYGHVHLDEEQRERMHMPGWDEDKVGSAGSRCGAWGWWLTCPALCMRARDDRRRLRLTLPSKTASTSPAACSTSAHPLLLLLLLLFL